MPERDTATHSQLILQEALLITVIEREGKVISDFAIQLCHLYSGYAQCMSAKLYNYFHHISYMHRI